MQPVLHGKKHKSARFQVPSSMLAVRTERRCLSPSSTSIVFKYTSNYSLHHSNFFSMSIKPRENIILRLRRTERRRASLKTSISPTPQCETENPLISVQSYTPLASSMSSASLPKTRLQRRRYAPKSATTKELKDMALLRVGSFAGLN